MPIALALKHQIEEALSHKAPSALTPRLKAELVLVPTGIAGFDELVGEGLPSGVITELVGAPCSGRSSVAMGYVSAITQRGSVCAWIDVMDSLDPESAAANGVDLERLLWVRCGPSQVGSAAVALGAVAVPEAAPGSSGPARHMGGGSPHPRSEGKEMPEAIGALLNAHGGLYDRQVRREKRVVGTPGAPNRPLVHRSGQREEQVNSDRLPARRGDNLAIAPRCAEPQPRRVASIASGLPLLQIPSTMGAGARANSKPWEALDQALRATDLLLQGGGFSAIVLDLGGVSPEFAWKIPLATWFRFRAACERTQVSLLLLTQHACARSSAELVVRMETGAMDVESRVVTGWRYRAAPERNRRAERQRVVPIRKPPQSERPGEWRSEAAWAQAK